MASKWMVDRSSRNVLQACGKLTKDPADAQKADELDGMSCGYTISYQKVHGCMETRRMVLRLHRKVTEVYIGSRDRTEN